MPVSTSIARLHTVSEADMQEMYRLHSRYFANVVQDIFMRDIHEKDWVIVLRDAADIVGFSTLQVLALQVDGKSRTFLFSGDTVVAHTHRQTTSLAGGFGHFMQRLMRERGQEETYWLLITKGYRTYRFLPVFFNRFHPACDEATPAAMQALLDAVCTHKFAAAYDAATGVIRAGSDKDRLRDDLQAIPAGRVTDRHVHFFLERNPGFTHGNELACITRIAADNLNLYARRVIEQTHVAWHE